MAYKACYFSKNNIIYTRNQTGIKLNNNLTLRLFNGSFYQVREDFFLKGDKVFPDIRVGN